MVYQIRQAGYKKMRVPITLKITFLNAVMTRVSIRSRLGDNLRSLVDASEIYSPTNMPLWLRQHPLVCQKQDVFRVGLGCLQPLEDN